MNTENLRSDGDALDAARQAGNLDRVREILGEIKQSQVARLGPRMRRNEAIAKLRHKMGRDFQSTDMADLENLRDVVRNISATETMQADIESDGRAFDALASALEKVCARAPTGGEADHCWSDIRVETLRGLEEMTRRIRLASERAEAIMVRLRSSGRG